MYSIYIYIFFWLNHLPVRNTYITNWLDVCNIWHMSKTSLSLKWNISGNMLLWDSPWWLPVYGLLLLPNVLRWKGLRTGIRWKPIICSWPPKESLTRLNPRILKTTTPRPPRSSDIKCRGRPYKKRRKKFVTFVMFFYQSENFTLNKVNSNQ